MSSAASTISGGTGSTDVSTGAAPEPWVRLATDEHDGSIEGFEVVAARRALALVKGKLGRDRLLELLADEIAAGDAYLREQVARSAGQETSGTTTLLAHGITAGQFVGWLARAFGREDVLLAGHPEHYSIYAGGGRVNIVETLGEHVCSFFMREWDDAASPGTQAPRASPGTQAPPAGGDAGYGRRSRMVLEDGTVIGSIENAFSDVDGGFTAQLSVTLPASCSRSVVEHHLEHFAVEFRNWILRAAAEQPAGAVSRR